jgi:hypothetical protein
MSAVEAGILTYNRHVSVSMLRPITVAAQRWNRTSFHLYARATKLAGRLDKDELYMCGVFFVQVSKHIIA